MNHHDDFPSARPRQPIYPPQRPPFDRPQPAQWTHAAASTSRPQPTRGWRRIVLVATLGMVNPGPSETERQEAAFLATIRSVSPGSYKVGVLGKGGVGKTTVAACVGSFFAQLRRGDGVVAVDADTAFGRLASRVDPRARSSFWELATDRNMESFADMKTRVGSNAAGLYVLAGEQAGGRRRVLDPALYREAARRLERHFNIAIIDCGSTMDAPVTREALRDLDALIVVSSPWADGAAAAARTMEWLADRERTGLVRRTVVVLNDSDGHADKRTRSVLAEQFLRHGQAVVEVPFDPHLRPGGVVDVMSQMAPGTRQKFLHITAIVAHHFASRPRDGRSR
jgi:MinD-like ATPase involved in chromosome partitioning or flagellar assembly